MTQGGGHYLYPHFGRSDIAILVSAKFSKKWQEAPYELTIRSILVSFLDINLPPSTLNLIGISRYQQHSIPESIRGTLLYPYFWPWLVCK